MIIVIDTSVFIAAVLGNPKAADIFDWIKLNKINWLATSSIIKEYLQMLKSKKFKFNKELINYWKNYINDNINLTTDSSLIKFSADPKDSIFINCANINKAAFLITEDKLLLKADYKIAGQIVTIEYFYKNVLYK